MSMVSPITDGSCPAAACASGAADDGSPEPEGAPPSASGRAPSAVAASVPIDSSSWSDAMPLSSWKTSISAWPRKPSSARRSSSEPINERTPASSAAPYALETCETSSGVKNSSRSDRSSTVISSGTTLSMPPRLMPVSTMPLMIDGSVSSLYAWIMRSTSASSRFAL